MGPGNSVTRTAWWCQSAVARGGALGDQARIPGGKAVSDAIAHSIRLARARASLRNQCIAQTCLPGPSTYFVGALAGTLGWLINLSITPPLILITAPIVATARATTSTALNAKRRKPLPTASPR